MSHLRRNIGRHYFAESTMWWFNNLTFGKTEPNYVRTSIYASFAKYWPKKAGKCGDLTNLLRLSNEISQKRFVMNGKERSVFAEIFSPVKNK